METNVKKTLKTKGIKTATDYIYSYINGQIESAGERAFVSFYDENGYDTESHTVGENDRITIKTTCKYNENNDLIEHKRYDCQNGKETIKTYKYDINNRLIEETYCTPDLKKSSKEFKYDGNGRLIEEAIYYPDIQCARREKYEYLTERNVTERNKYFGSSLLSSSKEKITKTGKETEDIYYNEDGTIEKRTITTYNSDSLPIKEIIYLQEDTPFSTTTKNYDKDCNLKEEIIEGKYSSFTKRYEYDKKGNIKELTCYKADGEPDYVYKTVFEYY